MKLEFLPAGSPDCPLLRIFDFSVAEARALRELCIDLSEGSTAAVSLRDSLEIIPIDDCSLALRRSDIDLGIERLTSNVFACSLTAESWREVADLIAAFCESQSAAEFQWLSEHSEISLLLSSNGQW
ncbi:MAG TPA: hypothetical protein VH370_10315 [Humisphaera sp.]|jgi:hypothetical protein|nr:hypothetical protein [Humisphaera sp.]